MVSEDWLTAARLRRLPAVLRVIQTHRPPGVALDHARVAIWNGCGGPLDEVSRLVEILVEAELVHQREGHFSVTRGGRRVATQDHQRGGRELALALIRRGQFAGQARRLIEASKKTPDGGIVCRRGLAQHVAPQLTGLLLRWPEVSMAPDLRVPPELVRDLLDVWGLLPKRVVEEDLYKKLGDRAELYSYRLERLAAEDPGSIRWVALENDGLGFDLEDVSTPEGRRIEVKGSAGAHTRFFLSANELRVARIHSGRYEIHFWGEIELARPIEQEYEQLMSLGYPRRYGDPAAMIERGELIAVPQKYLVETAKPELPGDGEAIRDVEPLRPPEAGE